MLFNLYMEKVFSTALENIYIGVKVNGKRMNNVRYADYTALIAEPRNLQRLLNAMNDVGVQYGLVINVEKTEFMVISREIYPEATLQIWKTTHISGLSGNNDGLEDENDQMLHMASITVCVKTWSLKVWSISKLEACKMWILRRILIS